MGGLEAILCLRLASLQRRLLQLCRLDVIQKQSRLWLNITVGRLSVVKLQAVAQGIGAKIDQVQSYPGTQAIGDGAHGWWARVTFAGRRAKQRKKALNLPGCPTRGYPIGGSPIGGHPIGSHLTGGYPTRV